MLVLIVGQGPKVGAVMDALGQRGVVAVVAINDDAALRVLETSDVALAVLIACPESIDRMWGELAKNSISAVISAEWATLRPPTRNGLTAVSVSPNASAQEIATACIAMLPRRVHLHDPEVLECGPLVIGLDQRSVSIDGQVLDVPPKEFSILHELLVANGTPISSDMLMGRVWSEDAIVTADDVHRHVYRLRGAIGDHDRDEPLIVNRRGFGYALTQSVRARGREPSRVGSALLSWVLTLIAGAWAFAHSRASRWRSQVSGACEGARICVEHAAAVLTAVVIASVGAPTPVSIAGRAEAAVWARSPSIGVLADRYNGSSISAKALTQHVELGESSVPTAPAPPAAGASIGRDERGASVGHWLSTWTSGAGAGEQGNDAWIGCDETSTASATTCSVFEEAPEGPRGRYGAEKVT